MKPLTVSTAAAADMLKPIANATNVKKDVVATRRKSEGGARVLDNGATVACARLCIGLLRGNRSDWYLG